MVIEKSRLRIHASHLEGGSESSIVVLLAQGSPLHHTVLDGDFPPLAVLHTVVYRQSCTPTGAPDRRQ